MQWALGIFAQGKKRPRREPEHSPQSTAKVKKWGSYTFNAPICLHGAYRDNFTFYFNVVTWMSNHHQVRAPYKYITNHKIWFEIDEVSIRSASLGYQNVFLHKLWLTTTGLRNATKRQKRLRSSTSAALTACFSVSSSRWRCSVTSCSEVSTRRCSSTLFPLRAFFCNRSVSVDRFFSSAFARLYSAIITKSVTCNKVTFLISTETASKFLN